MNMSEYKGTCHKNVLYVVTVYSKFPLTRPLDIKADTYPSKQLITIYQCLAIKTYSLLKTRFIGPWVVLLAELQCI